MWMDQFKDINPKKEEQMYVTEEINVSNNKKVKVFSKKIIHKEKHMVKTKIEGPELEVGQMN